MPARFCAYCGRHDDGRTPFIGSLCLECFVKLNKLLCVPGTVSFDYCRFCGALRLGYRWVEGGELGEAVIEYARRALSSVKPCRPEVRGYELVELKPVTVPSWRTVVRARYRVELEGGVAAEQEYTVEVRANPSICPSCHMARGGDYNVVVQLRGRLPPEAARKLAEKLDELSAKVVDVVERDGGVDILLEDRSAASRLLRELRKYAKLKIRYSGEDVGVTSRGRLRRRLVISVRVLE